MDHTVGGNLAETCITKCMQFFYYELFNPDVLLETVFNRNAEEKTKSFSEN